MASAGFVRYTGYDNADIFKNMLIEAYAAAKKNGLFFEGKIPMASTAEVSAAANYAAGDFSDVKSVKAGLQSWLSTQRIECDAGQPWRRRSPRLQGTAAQTAGTPTS